VLKTSSRFLIFDVVSVRYDSRYVLKLVEYSNTGRTDQVVISEWKEKGSVTACDL
jgi:hypothetical protein